MSRLVWPHAFQLFSRGLTEAFERGLARRAAIELLPRFHNRPVNANEMGLPVALRWVTISPLGFPRQPFKVWRRRASRKFERLGDNVPTNRQGDVEWGLREMCQLQFSAVPNEGATLTVEALDRRRESIPGQRIMFTSRRAGLFRAPGIAALRVSGAGTIRDVQGIDQELFANEPDWELIEVVGLPFDNGAIAPPAYTSTPQGYVPAARSGLEAAHNRLSLAAALHLPLPATGVADIPTPDWPPPDVQKYLQLLRDPDPSPLRMIDLCLRSTDDTTLASRQPEFLYLAKLDGIRQADIPGAKPGTDLTYVKLPVVGVTMLAIGNDSYAATGLGYGTVDFPVKLGDQRPPPGQIDPIEPSGATRTDFEYMVTAEYVFPFLGKLELAALAQSRPTPEAPAGLSAAPLRRNRAPLADAPETEAVRLRWNYALFPQGYGVLLSSKPGQSRLLNSRRPLAGGFEPFTPQLPASSNGSPSPGQVEFVDPVSPIPLSGTQSSRYLVIGTDVFGRWSSWRQVNYLVNAPPVLTPGLHAAKLEHNVAAAVGRVVPSQLQIEFSWDWSDRSLDRVVFYGRFFPAAGVPGNSFTGGLMMAATGPVGLPVTVQFNAARVPAISSPHAGSVELLTSSFTPPDPDRVKYLLTVRNLSCDFTMQSELAYEVFARAAERVRPTELSAVVGARVARTYDPLPPNVPVLPTDLQWTALADATGRARGVLTWPASPNAVGYVVWEATEAALRHMIAPTQATPLPGTSLLDRAASLRALLNSTGAFTRSLLAFTRVNTQIIHQTQLEIILPAGASTIYAYRVSAVTSSNIESARSNTVALFAVPRRNQPGQPKLMLRKVNPTMTLTAGGIQVIALPGAGPMPAGFRVYRVRNSALLSDVGSKGPPKIADNAPGWVNYTLKGRSGTPDEQGLAIVDAVAESWYPYYYQIVAIGLENLVAGEYRGESLPSAVVPGFLPPVNPPQLSLVANNFNATNRVLTFRTNLPVKPTTLGTAALEIIWIKQAAAGTRIERQRILTVDAHDVAEAVELKVLAAPTPSQLADLPKLNRRAPGTGGLTEYTVHLRAEVAHGAIVARDPLGRVTEMEF
jgi:hypothetical protein